jgi:capsid protein
MSSPASGVSSRTASSGRAGIRSIRRARFPEFSKALLHKVASGLDVSYASLTNDLADTSYSSSRVGLLDERDSYRDIQAWLIEGLHERVYAAWAPFAVLNGQLDARIRTADYLNVEWVPAAGAGWIPATTSMRRSARSGRA